MNTLHRQLTWLLWLSLIATGLAGIVIGLGAYTRLIDAGLGCPDWPGCYGHWIAPHMALPQQTLKAWAEMIHRYVAGTFGLLIIAITLLSTTLGFRFLLFAMGLFLLLIYQAVLGMWTVTLQLLPMIVTQHLLCGMLLLSLLWLIHLKTRRLYNPSLLHQPLPSLKPWVIIGFLLVFLQIFLGAWTSTNYAAFSCPSFPFCKAHTTQFFDFRHAFHLISVSGINYSGGRLDTVTRMTIHMTHRFGAWVVASYMIGMLGWIYFKIPTFSRKLLGFTTLILSTQIVLGILNIWLALPLIIAVAHNLCAALLLLCLVTMNERVFGTKESI